MSKQINLKNFRTMSGAQRRAAMRAHLAEHDQIDFSADCHTLNFAQQCALSEMAKAVSWRKAITSPLSLGLAFFVYLARDVVSDKHKAAQVAAPVPSVAYRAPRRRSYFLAA